MKHANRALTVLIFIFLYIPMAVLIVASFNTGKDITHFDGFTLQQYVRLFQDKNLLSLRSRKEPIPVLHLQPDESFHNASENQSVLYFVCEEDCHLA